ncbi:MAG: hypothetical protein M3328_11010 [Chloroflexota bacterium]|nr:hypothetical protein [Chloroflexota bacterium]
MTEQITIGQTEGQRIRGTIGEASNRQVGRVQAYRAKVWVKIGAIVAEQQIPGPATRF